MKALTALLVATAAIPLTAQTLEECRALRYHGKLTEAQTCFTRLAASSNLYLRAEAACLEGRGYVAR